MLVKIQWLCEHTAILRAYREYDPLPFAPYIWACTLKRESATVAHLAGYMDMTSQPFALADAIRETLHKEGFTEICYQKASKDGKTAKWKTMR